MKAFMLTTLALLLSFCSNEKTIKQLEITKVDFETSSIVKVSCDDLKKYFGSDAESITIINPKTLQDFTQIFNGLKPDNENYIPDIRAKIIIHYDSGVTDTLCMSDIGILVNGKSFLGDQKLVEYISATTETK
jgi:hypothetical protein